MAAALDYEIIGGKHHGALADKVANDVKLQRRQDVGLDPPPPGDLMLGFKSHTRENKQARALQGGTILMGRSTFKEYLSGVQRGYTESLELVNLEDALAQELSEDNVFDEANHDTDSPLQKNVVPLLLHFISHSGGASSEQIPDHLDQPLSTFPSLPPLLVIPFINRIGLRQVPMMVWDFFNRRQEFLFGGDAALTVIRSRDRSFQPDDLEWGKETEAVYKGSVCKIPSEIETSRSTYYKELPKRLSTARTLQRRDREPTKEEKRTPPPSEVELRAERLGKELKWRNNLRGWELVRPDRDIQWDDRFSSLRVFIGEGAQ